MLRCFIFRAAQATHNAHAVPQRPTHVRLCTCAGGLLWWAELCLCLLFLKQHSWCALKRTQVAQGLLLHEHQILH